MDMSMPANNIIVFGAAGAGKSTFINNVTKTSSCSVSSRRSVDGTSEVQSVFSLDKGLRFYDTVGLNSKNYVSSIGDLSDKLKVDGISEVSIILVCRKSEPRWTTWMTAFVNAVSQLVDGGSSHPKVIMYWVSDVLMSDPSDEMTEELKKSNIIVTAHLDDQNRLAPTFAHQVKEALSGSQNTLRRTTPRVHQPLEEPAPTPTKTNVKPKAKPAKSSNHQSPLTVFLGSIKVKAAEKGFGKVPLTSAISRVMSQVDITAIHNGKQLLNFAFIALAAKYNIRDVDCALGRAMSTASLFRVYQQVTSVTAKTETPEHHCNIIYAVAWDLYQQQGTVENKRALSYLIDLIFDNRHLTDECGIFEHYVNDTAAPSKIKKKRRRMIRKAVNKIIHKHSKLIYGQSAGSSFCHLDVEGCSDIDVYIQCKEGIEINEQDRTTISNDIKEELEKRLQKSVNMKYQSKATTYEWDDVSIDMVFSATTWNDPSPAPDAGVFHDNPPLQRAVRALKLLHVEDQNEFPHIGGRHIAAHVASVASVADSLGSDSSGRLLFIQCLRSISKIEDSDSKMRAWTSPVERMLSNKIPIMTALLSKMGIDPAEV